MDFLTPAIMIPAAAALAVVFFVLFLGFLTGRRGSTAESRLEIFTRRGSKTGSSQSIEIWKEALEQADKKNFLDQVMPNIPTLQKVFDQADVAIRPSAMAMLAVTLAVVATGISWAFIRDIRFAWIPGAIVFCIPWFYVLHRRKRRLTQFQQQMPDAMELLARALRAGQSLQAALHIVAEEMPPPICTEFGRVYEEQNLGKTLEDSLKDMCNRVPNMDFRFFTTSVLIQRQTGGDLAEILDKIGYVVRERFRIMGQVMALTGEGRLSGNVLLVLPFAVFLAVMHLNYEYASVLWSTPEGRELCLYAMVMMFIGAFFIRKIVNIKV
jgi:tight adherence protein B